MELADVEVFLMLAEELHFGRTADRMHISAARVSQRIRTLERQVGAALFDRTSRRVALTPLGTQLRERLAPAHAELLDAFDEARTFARATSGRLRIGFTATTGGEALSALVQNFETSHPTTRVSLHEVSIGSSHRALRRGDVDVLANWVVEGVNDLAFGPRIASFPRMLAVATDHPLAGRKAVSTDDMVEFSLPNLTSFEDGTGTPFSPAMSRSGRPFRYDSAPSKTTNEIIAQVVRGQVVHATATVLQPLAHRDDIVFVPITDLPPLELALIWVSSRETARIRALVRFVGESAERST